MTPDHPPDALAKLAAAVRAVDADHAAGRDRLLAALAAEPAGRPVPSSVWRKGFDMVRRHAGRGVLAAGLAAALVLGLLAIRPPGALAATAAAIREAGSFRARMSLVDYPDGVDAAGQDAGTVCWTPEGVRHEEMMDNKPQVSVELVGTPGLRVRHADPKMFWRLDPEREANPFFRAIGGLADSRGRGATPLGKRRVGEVRATGYVFPMTRLDPRADDTERMEVWFDPATHRPVRLLMVGGNMPAGKGVRLDGFEWGLPTAGWFDTTPPVGYKDATSRGPTDDEMTRYIVLGLRTFADKAGHYPRVKNVYGDTMGKELADLLGRPDTRGAWSLPIDPPFDPANADHVFGVATFGFTCINTIQSENPDPAYHGRTVVPGDGTKVLFRWKLDTGDYRVIFGDLEVMTVSADRLKQLER